MNSYKIDINCDLGESFGHWRVGNDEEILNHVSSANIACGYHAGDPLTMQRIVKSSLYKGVAIGAHPGLPDLVGFGRREMAVTAEEVYTMVIYQVGALQGFVKAEGATLHHVKPHGALYNMTAVNTMLAEAIAEALFKVCPEAILYGLAGSELIKAGQKAGLVTANEVFADRTYQSNGTLTPRSSPHALINDQHEAVHQVIRMIKENKVSSLQGTEVDIKPDTVCIHGDGPHALTFACALSEALKKESITLQSI